MRISIAAVLFAGLSCASASDKAGASPVAAVKIELTDKSIRIDGTEIRTEKDGCISLDALQKALGPYADMHADGLGVQVYSWPGSGIQVLRGWRGPEKDKCFKILVWFVDDHGKSKDKRSGRFAGEVFVDGVVLGAHSSLRQIRPDLEKARFLFEEEPGFIKAGKGSVAIFTVDGTDALQRIEVWTVD